MQYCLIAVVVWFEGAELVRDRGVGGGGGQGVGGTEGRGGKEGAGSEGAPPPPIKRKISLYPHAPTALPPKC